MKNAVQRVILCEGFDDRDFLQGLLPRLGCKRANDADGKVRDPWKKTVSQGMHGYRCKDGETFLLVHQVGGKHNLQKVARTYLSDQNRPCSHLLVTLDLDDKAESDAMAAFAGLAEEFELSPDPSRESRWAKANQTLSAALWNSEQSSTPGIPEEQTLERLICTALVRAYEEGCGEAVDSWLAASPYKLGSVPVDATGKRHLWSFFSKWFANYGRDYFFQKMWTEEAVAKGLEQQLRLGGTWARFEEIAV